MTIAESSALTRLLHPQAHVDLIAVAAAALIGSPATSWPPRLPGTA